ncbi:hypothetical protein [Nocardia inohanensis]|uniref:hypothetical protein n=1 Tax=Nocardia inohanensis TaxID=209246 RepID=UPI00082E7C41|nr:hypothetical protein [Nocardia inohanensis]
MSVPTGSAQPSRRTTFYNHARALARRYPDIPLPRAGRPYPDADRRDRCRGSDDESDFRGIRTSRLIDEYFSAPTRHRDIAKLYREVIEYDIESALWPSVREAISRADPGQARELGRHLTLTSTDQNPTVLGMALLAVAGTEQDVRLIQTIGLLSNTFGLLAAQALARLPDATTNLIWLADRTAGWGRVYLVYALCELGDPAAEPWLLRKACNGDDLTGEFAYKVSCAAPVHTAIAAPDADETLIDHTGELMSTMAWCDGMGGTLWDYGQAEQVLTDYLSHVRGLAPSSDRYRWAWALACFLDGRPNVTAPDWATLAALRVGYWSLLNTPSWHCIPVSAANSDNERTREWANRVLDVLGRRGAERGE